MHSVPEGLAKYAGINHHLSTVYCPCANATVDRLCEDLLRAAKSNILRVVSSANSVAICGRERKDHYKAVTHERLGRAAVAKGPLVRAKSSVRRPVILEPT